MRSTHKRQRFLALALAWLTAASLAGTALADETEAEPPGIRAEEPEVGTGDAEKPVQSIPEDTGQDDPVSAETEPLEVEPAETERAEEEPAAEEPAETEQTEPLETESSGEENSLPSFPVLLAPPLPAVDGASSWIDMPFLYSSDMVQMRLAAMEATYYEGYPWGNGAYYYSPVFGGASACVGFAYLMSDAAFDDLPARTLYRGSFSYNDIHVGDLLWEYGGGYTHMVVVLEKYDDHVILVEGNYNNSVHWRRYKARSKSDGTGVVELYGVLITRYPVHLAGDVNGDKMIEAWDAAYLLQYFVGDRSGQDTTAGDSDSSGRLNVRDASYILQMEGMKQDGLILRPTGN